MAVKKLWLGKAQGCSLRELYVSRLGETAREGVRQREKDYPHLCLCPESGGNWLYREQCDYCRHARFWDAPLYAPPAALAARAGGGAQ